MSNPNPQPSLAELRRDLNRLDDVDLDSLLMDYFPVLQDKVSRGMRKDEKINLLLDHVRRWPEQVPQLVAALEVQAAGVAGSPGPAGQGRQGATMVQGPDTQGRILDSIPTLQESDHQYVSDEKIAGSLGLPIQDVQDHLALMEEAGLVQLAKSVRGSSAVLTARGRVARTDPAYRQPASRSGDTYVFSGNFQGAFVNVNSVLDRTSQSIGAIPNADPGLKEELEGLVQELKAALQQAPPAQAEEAEAVAEFAQELVENATEEKPNKVRLRISAEGLKQAAENLAAVVPPVVAIASQIAGAILRFTGAM